MLQEMFSRFVIVALAAKQVIGMFENGSEKKPGYVTFFSLNGHFIYVGVFFAFSTFESTA